MMVFKLSLLTIFRLIIWAAVKVVLILYILSLPDSPRASVVHEAETMQAIRRSVPRRN